MEELKTPAGIHLVAREVFYMRNLIANLCLVGNPESQPAKWVLIDTGLPEAVNPIREAALALYRDTKPQAIILSHGHFDHVGAVEELAAEWGVPVYTHKAELPYLTGQTQYPPADPLASDGLMAKLSPLYPRDPVNLRGHLETLPDDGSVPYLPGWCWIFTPGHTPGHVSFFRESDRVLIAGDALTTVKQESAWAVMLQKQEVHGPPAYFTTDWEAARRSIERLQKLNPAVVITGHGQPMQGKELHKQLAELSSDFNEDSLPEAGRYSEAAMNNQTAKEPSLWERFFG